MTKAPSWTISVISHGHGQAILGVLSDLHKQLSGRDYRIVVTRNLPEAWDLMQALTKQQAERTQLRANPSPLGFGANHNAALSGARSDHLLMVDPDLRLPDAIFATLDAALADAQNAVVSPRAVTPEGALEDNGRPVLTPLRLLRRYLLGRQRDTRRIATSPHVDWLAGLCLAMRSSDFHALGGFDTGYFMYAEDIDLCLRAQLNHGDCTLLDSIRVVHPARRATLRSRHHLLWHLRSLIRLWRSPVYREFRRHQKTLQT